MAQHHTGVDWREWGDEAFAEARARELPILLDIGAVWCHWCHVMDTGIPGDPIHTGTYSDSDVQSRIAQNFVPIKVDNDRRPDINARYNTGGWPTTVFLTPEGDPIYGETYVPPPRMVALLDHISGLWQTRRDEILEQTGKMRQERDLPKPHGGGLDAETLPTVLDAIAKAFDPEYGGFGTQPKFPHPDALLLMLEHAARTGDDGARAIVILTLQEMAGGGMYDQFAGGFFRYSTTQDWSVPHYEKMLEDNAKLTHVYALATAYLEVPSLWETVKTAHHWIVTDLRDPQQGTFAGSQDADAEEKYYGLPLDKRSALPTPYIDRTAYAGWNALTVSSFATRFALTGDSDSLQIARHAFDTLRQSARPGEGDILILPHILGQEDSVRGLLSDATAALHAALDLYEAEGQAETLSTAVQIADALCDALEDKEQGGFYDILPDPQGIGALAFPRKDMTANAEAALGLQRVAILSENHTYRDAGERALCLFTQEYAKMGYFAAAYARAVDSYLHPPLHLVLVGESGDERLAKLRRAAWTVPYPGRAIETLASADTQTRGFPPTGDGTPCAYVCIGETCHAPVATPEALRKTVIDNMR